MNGALRHYETFDLLKAARKTSVLPTETAQLQHSYEIEQLYLLAQKIRKYLGQFSGKFFYPSAL